MLELMTDVSIDVNDFMRKIMIRYSYEDFAKLIKSTVNQASCSKELAELIISELRDKAEPVPEAEVLKLIYRPKRTTRYDWSNAPKNAKYMYTDSTGDIFCSTERYSLSGFMCNWVFVKGIDYNRCLLVKGIKTCEDWDKSEEARPE